MCSLQGVKADSYSLAGVIIFMLIGRHPRGAVVSSAEMIGNPQCQSFVKALGQDDKTERFDMFQAANHPWLQSTMHELITNRGAHPYLSIADDGTVHHKPAAPPRQQPVKGASLNALQAFQRENSKDEVELRFDLLISTLFAGVEEARSDAWPSHQLQRDARYEADMALLCYRYNKMEKAELHLEKALSHLGEPPSDGNLWLTVQRCQQFVWLDQYRSRVDKLGKMLAETLQELGLDKLPKKPDGISKLDFLKAELDRHQGNDESATFEEHVDVADRLYTLRDKIKTGFMHIQTQTGDTPQGSGPEDPEYDYSVQFDRYRYVQFLADELLIENATEEAIKVMEEVRYLPLVNGFAHRVFLSGNPYYEAGPRAECVFDTYSGAHILEVQITGSLGWPIL